MEILNGVLNQIEYPEIANPYPGTIPAMKFFNITRIRILFQSKKGFYDFIVDPWGKGFQFFICRFL